MPSHTACIVILTKVLSTVQLDTLQRAVTSKEMLQKNNTQLAITSTQIEMNILKDLQRTIITQHLRKRKYKKP